MIQDWKSRKISVLLVVLLLICTSMCVGLNTSVQQALRYLAINTALLVVQLLLLTAYYSLKNKKLHNIVDDEFGLGDILFLVALTPLFSVFNWMMFLIFGTLFSVVIMLLLPISVSKNEVPFVSLIGIPFILVLVAMKFALIPVIWKLTIGL